MPHGDYFFGAVNIWLLALSMKFDCFLARPTYTTFNCQLDWFYPKIFLSPAESMACLLLYPPARFSAARISSGSWTKWYPISSARSLCPIFGIRKSPLDISR